ncbi:hypothetical protein J2S30_000737 [Herbaspirillum rubrisubalbicans]|nr:hypothetical protein [Herbaspirillum rubrisubalbicans]
MKTFHCDNCGLQVFFENTVCGNCGWMLGYQPELLSITSFSSLAPETPPADDVAPEPGPGRWRSLRPDNEGRVFKQCLNYWRENICNWMLDAREAHELCASCRLTRVIPTLDEGNNRVLWSRLETAKRRLLHSLWTLRLQPVPKMEDEETGLAFEFLQDQPHGERVLTGHADGVITINIAEGRSGLSGAGARTDGRALSHAAGTFPA